MHTCKPKITREEYVRCRTKTVSVLSAPLFMQWVYAYAARRLRLLGDHRGTFTRMLGPCHWTYRGEHVSHVWVVQFMGETFLVFSAAVRGTTIEVVCDTPDAIADKGGAIVAFANHLLIGIEEHQEKDHAEKTGCAAN